MKSFNQSNEMKTKTTTNGEKFPTPTDVTIATPYTQRWPETRSTRLRRKTQGEQRRPKTRYGLNIRQTREVQRTRKTRRKPNLPRTRNGQCSRCTQSTRRNWRAPRSPSLHTVARLQSHQILRR